MRMTPTVRRTNWGRSVGSVPADVAVMLPIPARRVRKLRVHRVFEVRGDHVGVVQHAGDPGETTFHEHDFQRREAVEHTAERQLRPLQPETLHLRDHADARGAGHGGRNLGSKTAAKRIVTVATEHSLSALTGSVEAFLPLQVDLVQNKLQRQLFRELVSRYHYLGYAIPYGARLQYLVYVDRPRREVVGCVQFSSPAWRIKVRDQWIGWDDATRRLRLQHVVNNSRFLVLAQIDNLASKMLSGVMRQLRGDWLGQYGVEPWLVETMVERQRFHGGCYRAANFQEIGQTSGRGRMDLTHQRHGAEVKTILLYQLIKHAKRKLAGGER